MFQKIMKYNYEYYVTIDSGFNMFQYIMYYKYYVTIDSSFNMFQYIMYYKYYVTVDSGSTCFNICIISIMSKYILVLTCFNVL